MDRRHRILLLLAFVAAVSLALVILSIPGEPSYEGRTLTEWLLSFPPAYRSEFAMGNNWPSTNMSQVGVTRTSRRDRPTPALAREAVRQIGAKAIPSLVAWIAYEPSAWRLESEREFDRVMAWMKLNYRWNSIEKGEIRSRLALSAFEILGSEAREAIPDLTRIINDPRSTRSASPATKALGFIGVESLPPLMAVLTNRQARARGDAVGAISAMGSNARPAVPELIARVSDEDEIVSGTAAQLLSTLQLEPELVVPAMMSCVSSTNRAVRLNAASVLVAFGEEARPAVPALIQHLTGSNEDLAELAAQTLGRLKIEPAITIPALTTGIGDPRPLVRFYSTGSLSGFGKEARSAVPALLGALNSPDLYARMIASNALESIAPEVLTNVSLR